MENLQDLANALTNAEPSALAELLVASSDVAVVIGEDNIIHSVAVPGDLSMRLDTRAWPGQPFDQIVTADTRRTADLLLRSARMGETDSRELAHGADDGARVELRYAAAALGSDRPLVLVGRAIASGFENGRDAFARVFDFGSQPVIVVDGSTGRILEADSETAAHLGVSQPQLLRMVVFDLIGTPWRREAQSRLRGVLASQSQDRFVAEAGASGDQYVVVFEPRTGANAGSVLVRFLAPGTEPESIPPATSLAELVAGMTECVALLETDGRIRWANQAFQDAVGAAQPSLLLGRPLDEVLSPVGDGDYSLSLASARKGDSAVSTEVTLVDREGAYRTGRLSLAWLANADPQGFGAVLDLAEGGERLRGVAAPDAAAILELVGSVPLKDLVRDTTDAIERLCIEAALRLTGDNRAAAARALGLSRQALYLKLERYGLGGS